MLKLLESVIVLLIISVNENYEIKAESGVELDYTEIAWEAENNKNDILSFLNNNRVQKQYKELYDSLLSKLVGGKKLFCF